MEHHDRNYLTVCAIIKDESLYIEEWIEFHCLVGVERFHIYDNNSTDHVKQLLIPYIQKDIVVYHEWPIHPGQMDAYDHYLENFGNGSTWTAFIDADEFLFGTKEDNLRDILERYKQFPGVCVNWVCFGSSDHIRKPKGLVIENFTRRPALEFDANRHVKCIVQPQKVIRSVSPHTFLFKNDDWPVTEDGNKVRANPLDLPGALSEKCSIETIRINHYVIKSKEECEIKLKKTRADKISRNRGIDYFLYFDNNTEKDEEILRFLFQLKENLALRKDLPVMPVDFDWEQYIANYPDLQLAGIKTKEKALQHWVEHGYFEKRNYKNTMYEESLKLIKKYSKEDLTVIIPIKNRFDYRLSNALKSLRHQDYDKDLIDIMVIDYDGSDQLIGPLTEICKEYNARYIRIEDRPVWSRSRCLNIGIRQTKTKYVLLTDVDIIFEMNYISQALKELKDNPCKIIRCTFRNSNKKDIDDKTDIISDYQVIKDKTIFIHEIADQDKSAYGKSIILVLTDFLRQIGGLDEFYAGWGFEDEDLFKRLELMGLRSINIDDRTSFVHQWHPVYEGLGPQEKRIEENRKYYLSTSSIIRNQGSWGTS